MKPIFTFCLLFFFLIIVHPAKASTCRDYQQQTICINNIERSAKYYCQYKVNLTINGEKQPQTIYNCCQKLKQSKNNNVIAFSDNDPGKLICSLFDKN